MNKTNSKAIKAGRLAVSAETLGNEQEADAAGRRAGAVARTQGLTLETLWASLPGINQANVAWNAMVDGWYEAA